MIVIVDSDSPTITQRGRSSPPYLNTAREHPPAQGGHARAALVPVSARFSFPRDAQQSLETVGHAGRGPDELASEQAAGFGGACACA